MRNAIPRDGEAIVLVPAMHEEKFLDIIAKCQDTFAKEYNDIEKDGVKLTATKIDETPKQAVPHSGKSHQCSNGCT